MSLRCPGVRPSATVLAVAVSAALTAGLPLAAGQNDDGASEIDRFMERVLERRAENAAVRRQYVLDEDVRFRVTGPGGEPLWGSHREYTWYERDGIFVRSPVRAEGVDIDEERRREYENEWLARERRSARRRRPDGVSRATISMRSPRTNVEMAIERLWGGEVDGELLDAIVDEALAWGDHHAAIVAASHRILAARGGIGAVGFDVAVTQARDGFVMLEEGRLYPNEVAAMLEGIVSAAAPAAAGASDEGFGRLLELLDLAVRFRVRFAPPEATGMAGARRAAFADAREAVLGIPEPPAEGDPAGAAAEGSGVLDGDGWQIPGSVETIPEPRFVSDAYFLDFAFEPGNYLLAGRETLNGREVLRIEYYPDELFVGHADPGAADTEAAAADRSSAASMNKTSLITLWIDPAEHQVIRYTFDNLGFDFLPGRWLVRLDDLTATMTMGQPFEGVWLPEEIEIRAAMSLATGSYEMTGTRSYSNHRAADSGGRIRTVGPVVR